MLTTFKSLIYTRNFKQIGTQSRFNRFLSLCTLNRSDEKDDASKKSNDSLIHQESHEAPDTSNLDYDETGTYCPPLARPLPKQPHEHPTRRVLNIFGVTGRNDPKTDTHLHFPRHTDILIIGGIYLEKCILNIIYDVYSTFFSD